MSGAEALIEGLPPVITPEWLCDSRCCTKY